jgi:hypothetical protein
MRNAISRLYTKTCTKLQSKSFNMIYFVFIRNLLKSILCHKINIVLCSTSGYNLFMPKYTSSELIMILYLPEIFILDLCLVF